MSPILFDPPQFQVRWGLATVLAAIVAAVTLGFVYAGTSTPPHEGVRLVAGERTPPPTSAYPSFNKGVVRASSGARIADPSVTLLSSTEEGNKDDGAQVTLTVEEELKKDKSRGCIYNASDLSLAELIELRDRTHQDGRCIADNVFSILHHKQVTPLIFFRELAKVDDRGFFLMSDTLVKFVKSGDWTDQDLIRLALHDRVDAYSDAATYLYFRLRKIDPNIAEQFLERKVEKDGYWIRERRKDGICNPDITPHTAYMLFCQ